MLINEIFDSTISITWKQITANKTQVDFEVDDKQYRMYIVAQTYQFNNQTFNFLNVGFSRMLDDDTETEKITHDTKNASKVFGAVYNGIWKEIQHYKADGIAIIATDNIEKRQPIYEWIARQCMHVGMFSTFIRNIKVKRGVASILLSNNIDDQTRKQLIDHLSSVTKP